MNPSISWIKNARHLFDKEIPTLEDFSHSRATHAWTTVARYRRMDRSSYDRSAF